MTEPSAQERVLVLAPTAADAAFCRRLLAEAGMDCQVCADLGALCQAIDQGAGAILLTEEALTASHPNCLVDALREQPEWSDLPVIILSAKGADSPAAVGAMELLGNVTVMERPIRLTTLVSALRSGLKARRRQYELRSRLEELRASEAAVRYRGEQFQTLVDCAPVGVYLIDAEFRILHMNPIARSVFAGVADLIGRDFAEVIHILWNDRADEIVKIFRRTLETGEAYFTPEHAAYRPDHGVVEYYEWRTERMLLPNGQFGVVCYFQDISRQVNARLALKELDQRKDEFIANMSHEMRTPLTGILGYADLLLERLDDPDHIQCAKTILASGNHLMEIVTDILDLAKIQAGKLVLHIEPFSPHAVFAEVHKLLDVRAREKSLALILGYEGALPESIETDRTRLRQILMNLVSNAIKFTQRGSVEIVVRFLAEEGSLQIEVADTGIGIAPEQRRVLFEPFSQADTTSTRQYGGTGLGLTITKRLVEMLGGRIWFESEPGKGSKFYVTIPAKQNQTDSLSGESSKRSNQFVDVSGINVNAGR
jgi:PAS domain S-box-containing protein